MTLRNKQHLLTTFRLLLFLYLHSLGILRINAQFTFSDEASNYGGSWNNSSNNGTGFNAWTISTGGGSSGTFIGNPSAYGMGTSNITSTAFGLYGHSAQYVNAVRYFGGSGTNIGMQIGDVFSFYWSMNWDCGSSGSKGFDFRSGTTSIFNVNNTNSSTITTSNGNANTNYGTTAMLVTLTRSSSTQYTFEMTSRSGGSAYSTTINSNAEINNINIYCGNQQNNAGERNIFFNKFTYSKANNPYVIGANLTEPRILAGSSALTKTGNYNLTLSASNTYTGSTTINEGLLIMGSDNALGTVPVSATPGHLTIGNGSLGISNTLTLNSNRGITINNNSSSLDVFGGSTLTYNGIIVGSGTHQLNKIASGTLILGGANTYTGNTLISAGTLKLAASSSSSSSGPLGTTAAGTTVSSGAVLDLNGNSLSSVATEALTLNGDGISSGGALINTVNTAATYAGSITLGSSSRIDANQGEITLSGGISGGANVLYVGGTGNTTVNSIISGSGNTQDGTTTSLYKNGAGTLTLSGANAYTGDTRIIVGSLTVNSGGSLGSGSDIFISSGATLNINTNTTIASVQETGNSNGGSIAIGSGATLTLTGADKGTVYQNSISGAGGLTLAASGTTNLSLYGTQNYTGATSVSGGTLTIPVAASTSGITISGGTLNINHNSATGSGTLTLNGGTINVDATRTISNPVSIGGSFTFTGTANLTQGTGAIALTASPTVTISANTLTLGGIISGGFGFTKNGNGTMVLTGANAYTGSTSVSAGTLQLSRSGGNTLPATNNVTVNGGTLKVSTNQTLNNLSVTSGILVIDVGVTLTINGTYTGGGTITNNGSIVLNTTSFPGSSSTISSMNNLTINRSLGVTLDKDLTLTGTLTLTSGTMDIGNNTLTINSNSISRTSGDIDADNGTLVFTNSSILTVPASTIKSGTIKNLTINGAGIILANGTTVSGALSLSSGTLDLGNTTLAYSGSNITRSSGDIDADAGNLEFANTSAITLPASVIKTGTIDNLTMNGTGGVSLGQNITISTSVALSSGILSLGNYNLTMNGTFSGSPGSTCYIKTDGSGSVTKNSMAVSSTPFTFPVGNSAFNKLTIANLTAAADNFGVRVIDEVYDNGTGASGATVLSTKPRVKRTWQITKGTGSSNSSNGVDMGFYWESSHESSPAPVSYTVFHHNGTKWQEITITAAMVGTNFTEIDGYKGSFSPFAVGDNVTPLPVTWLYNRCETSKSVVGIEWGTAEEKNVKTFTVEKSSSGQSFVPIGSIAGSGNSHIPRHYRFEDKNPNPEGAYYRIKQTGQTGDESYSKTCFANSIKNAPSAIISTTDNEVLITTGNADNETSHYVIYNTAGKIMLKGQFTGSQARIPIGHLMVGFYEITIQSASGNHAQKMLINPK